MNRARQAITAVNNKLRAACSPHLWGDTRYWVYQHDKEHGLGDIVENQRRFIREAIDGVKK